MQLFKVLKNNNLNFENYDFINGNDQEIVQKIMGYCHNVVSTSDETIGDVLDIEMEKCSIFSNRPQGTVLNIFEFESKL